MSISRRARRWYVSFLSAICAGCLLRRCVARWFFLILCSPLIRLCPDISSTSSFVFHVTDTIYFPSYPQIAKEVASKFRPGVNIKAHLANIKDAQFSVDWFASFNLVFNALDNLEARRHVNKMCLAAEVPLIESGTTGFNGQVQVIKKVGVNTSCSGLQGTLEFADR